MLVDKVLVEFFLGEEELELDLDLLDFAAACRVVDILPSWLSFLLSLLLLMV
jgi:hypothetical protein